jgi:hypothetical protein
VPHPLQMRLPTASAVLNLSRRELAAHILTTLNQDHTVSASGQTHQGNYVRNLDREYGFEGVQDAVVSAWNWAVQNDYLVSDPTQSSPGWYKLTRTGARITSPEAFDALKHSEAGFNILSDLATRSMGAIYGPEGTLAGWAIVIDEGVAVTLAHVIGEPNLSRRSFQIRFGSGVFQCEEIGRDSTADLAILRIPNEQFGSTTLRPLRLVEPPALGSPVTLLAATNSGFDALSSYFAGEGETRDGFRLQFAVADRGPLSGSPVLDATGSFIYGICASANAGPPRIVHAIPSATITDLLTKSLIEFERTGEPYVQTYATPANLTPPAEVPPRLADYIAADGWTLIDKIGYERYLKALSAFITDPRTIAPLCISIQAPWGGGKTSLMRMLQLRLDRTAIEHDNADALNAYDRDIAIKTGEPARANNDSITELRRNGETSLGSIGIGDVLNILDAWKKSAVTSVDTNLEVSADVQKTCVTVWFNAWKYEGTNQVWAGLADSIISQITRRMPLGEREAFFLKLRLARIDADKIRSRIYERIYRVAFQNVLPRMFAWTCLAVTSLLTGLVGMASHQTQFGWIGAMATTIFTVIGFSDSSLTYNSAKKAISEEKATATLSDFVTMPSYETEIGFLHKVEADLRKVLALVPKTYWPIVIFIDDLDRSSPSKVAQVMEAVNLFLAGEFSRCIFVMGMDSEMVAASLDVAHKDVISALPHDARIPVGWRFMDKFVQLPFVIPPVATKDVISLSRSIGDAEHQQRIRTAIKMITDRRDMSGRSAMSELEKLGLSEDDAAYVLIESNNKLEERAQDDMITTFDDDRADVREVVQRGMHYFSGNPRETKRFLNAFRLHVFLWGDKARSGTSILSLSDIMRWTVFMLKWPDVMRWVRRAPRFGSFDTSPEPTETNPWEDDGRLRVINRLEQLENLSSRSATAQQWIESLQNIAGVRDKPRWLYDEELFQFLKEPVAHPGRALSAGVGEGLW